MGTNSSFRDFLAYLLPGALTLFFLSDWLGIETFLKRGEGSVELSEGLKESILFAAMSFITGYVQSRIPLVLFNLAHRKNVLHQLFAPCKNEYRIEHLSMTDDFKDLIASLVKKTFDLKANEASIMKQNEVFYLCSSFVVQHTDEHSFLYARRLSAFAILDAVVWIPLVFLAHHVLQYTHMPCKFLLFTAISLALVVGAYVSFCYHRNNWCRQVFQQFIVIASHPEFIKEKD